MLKLYLKKCLMRQNTSLLENVEFLQGNEILKKYFPRLYRSGTKKITEKMYWGENAICLT